MIREIWKRRGWYGFLAPFFLAFAVFQVYPVLEAFRLSLYHTDGLYEQWAGLGNYTFLLQNRIFWNAIVNTLVIAFLGFPAVIVPAVALASLINSARAGQNVFKVIFFAPYVTAIVASAGIWAYLLHPDPEKGLINWALGLVGITGIRWLAHPSTSKFAVVVYDAWRTMGYAMVLFLAGLQDIPREYYEAAEIDGAGPLRSFRFVTLPLLRPVFVFVMIAGFIAAMSRFADVYMLGDRSGAPARSIQTVVLYIYELAFSGRALGKGAATGVLLFIIILVMTLINLRTMHVFGEEA